MPIADALDTAGVATCDSLLLRAVALLDAVTPLLTRALFPPHAALSTATCVHNPNLAFSTGEPAINIYTEGGGFQPHEDKQSLTVLVNLSTPGADFQGGGTAFWSSKAACDPETGRGSCVTEPTMALCPPAGSALVFGGNVTHAGQRVLGGQRCVFVASFSPLSDAATAAASATAIATAETTGTHASPGAGGAGTVAASDREVYQTKQQRLRVQRNAYEARVEAEEARRLALVSSLQSLTTED